MKYLLLLLFFFLINNDSLGAKKINVDGVYYKCKSPKNFFERTEGSKIEYVFLVKKIKIKLI
tara:strand:+ start:141 stop:326 length:186 start_codon:yes stop_codon:yes gene_type:complete